VAPDIPVEPDQALALLRATVARERPDVVVGTSMGAMYAQQLRGVRRICVNPSFGMSKLYSLLHVGKYKWLNRRRDGEVEFHVYKDTISRFAEMEAHQFDGITDEDRPLCSALFGTEDEITRPSRDEFELHYPGQSTMFEGGHRLNSDLVHSVLIPAIRKLTVSLVCLAMLFGSGTAQAAEKRRITATDADVELAVSMVESAVRQYNQLSEADKRKLDGRVVQLVPEGIDGARTAKELRGFCERAKRKPLANAEFKAEVRTFLNEHQSWCGVLKAVRIGRQAMSAMGVQPRELSIEEMIRLIPAGKP